MPYLAFQPDEVTQAKQYLFPDQSLEATWNDYVSNCNQPSVVKVSTWDELSAAVSSSIPGSVILLKGTFWHGRVILNHAIHTRHALESVIRMRPELFELEVPRGLTLLCAEALYQIPYRLDDIRTGWAVSQKFVFLFLIDPDLYVSPQ